MYKIFSINLIQKLELDGKKIDLPHLESKVILNIPFWGGGVEPRLLGKNETRTDIPETRFSILLNISKRHIITNFYLKCKV